MPKLLLLYVSVTAILFKAINFIKQKIYPASKKFGIITKRGVKFPFSFNHMHYFVAKTFLSFANLGNPFSNGGLDSP